MKNWEYMFDPEILERGLSYYYTKLVSSIEKTDQGYHAVVQGTKAYEVDITMDGDSVKEMHCSCPYARRGARCKHMVAVLYQVKYGVPVLHELEDHHVVIENEPDELKHEVMEIFYALSFLADDFGDEEDSISWRSGMDYADAFVEVLDSNIGSLIEEKKYMTAFYGLQKAFYLLNAVEMNGSFGEHSMIADRMEEYWKQIIPYADEEEKKLMYRWFDSMEDDERYLICSDTTVRILNDSFEDEKYRKARLEKLKRSIEQEKDEIYRERKEEQYRQLCRQYSEKHSGE